MYGIQTPFSFGDLFFRYPLISQHTFPTKFIPFRRAEAEALVLYYKTRFRIKRDRDFSLEDARQLELLRIRLAQCIEGGFSFWQKSFLCAEDLDGEAFIRLCGRSPKDGESLHPDSMFEDYLQTLRKLENEEEKDDPNVIYRVSPVVFDEQTVANTKFRALLRVPTLKVRSGEDALNLLSTSERHVLRFILIQMLL